MSADTKSDNTAKKLPDTRSKRVLDRERYRLATRIARTLAGPMTVLGFVWLFLLVLDFTTGLAPWLRVVSYTIWVLFILQFLLEFFISPKKVKYLRTHWLTAIALLVPAFRVFGVFRAFRALRSLRLVRVVGSTNRGMRSLGRVMDRSGFRYVASLSTIVAMAGAAGMYAFEHRVAGSTIRGFGSALWWTSMTLTTMGSDYFPKTSNGRVLCFLLALYGFAVFGYVTATIARFFVERDAETSDGQVAGSRQLDRLEREIAALHAKLDQVVSQGRSAS